MPPQCVCVRLCPEWATRGLWNLSFEESQAPAQILGDGFTRWSTCPFTRTGRGHRVPSGLWPTPLLSSASRMNIRDTQGGNALLVDVRTQPEWAFVGTPDLRRARGGDRLERGALVPHDRATRAGTIASASSGSRGRGRRNARPICRRRAGRRGYPQETSRTGVAGVECAARRVHGDGGARNATSPGRRPERRPLRSCPLIIA